MRAQRIKLNLIPGGVIPVVNVSQYDVGRPLEFALYDGPTVATIAAGTVIDIRATKPDGTGFEYACTWSNNIVSIATQAQMTVLSGSIECELHLVKDEQEIGTANFILEVEASALRADTNISETELPDIIDAARRSAAAAATSESNAEAYAVGKRGGVDVTSGDPAYQNNSKYYAGEAADSESAAGYSATAAATSESNSEAYAVGKRGGVDVPSTDPTYNNNSKYYSESAGTSATAAATSKSDSEAYAVGKRGGVDVPSTDPTYNNNAKYYSEVAQQAAAGGIIPKGTTAFAQLPALADSQVGDMWNISDAFVTTSDFREGAGAKYGAGANVYKTSDNKWDVTGGQRVTMTGATSSTDGTAGEVPAPLAGQQDYIFMGNGGYRKNSFFDEALSKYAIERSGGTPWNTFVSNNRVTFFTNWDDRTHFPSEYGSGVMIPALDGRYRYFYYQLSDNKTYVGKYDNQAATIEWVRIDDRELIADAWQSGAYYNVDYVRTYNNKLYRCIQAHTSSDSLTPTNTTYWEERKVGGMIWDIKFAMDNLMSQRSVWRKVIDITSGTASYTLTHDAYVSMESTAYNFSDAGVKLVVDSSEMWLQHFGNNCSKWAGSQSTVYLKKGSVLKAVCNIGSNGGTSVKVYVNY